MAINPELIFEEMRESVKRDLANYLGGVNSWLVLEFLEGKTDAISFVGAWAPIGAHAGNQIYHKLIEEELVRREETLDDLKKRLRNEKLEYNEKNKSNGSRRAS